MQPAKGSVPGSNGHLQHYGGAGSYPGVPQANGSSAGQPSSTHAQFPGYAAAYQQPYQYAQAQPYSSLYAAQPYAEQPGFKQLATQATTPARYDPAAYAYTLQPQHYPPPAPAVQHQQQQQQQTWPHQPSYPQLAAYSHPTAYPQHAAYAQQSAYPAQIPGMYQGPTTSLAHQQPARSSNMQRLLTAANTYRDQHRPNSPMHQQPPHSHQQAVAQHGIPALQQLLPDQPPGRAVSQPTSGTTQPAGHAVSAAAVTHASSEVTQPASHPVPAYMHPAAGTSKHPVPTALPQHASERQHERHYDDGTRFSDEEEDRKEHLSSGWDSDSDGHPGRSR